MSSPRILSARDGILRVGGLPGCMFNEQLVFSDGSSGWALRLEEDAAVVALLDRGHGPGPGAAVAGTGHLLRTPTGPALLGRVVDPLGRPLDGLGPIPTGPARRLDPPAPGLAEIVPPAEALGTGVKFLDALYPMTWGQSRAFVGPRRSGKTALALDAILHQRGGEAVCVYAAVGQCRRRLAATVGLLRAAGALPRVVVVATVPDDPPGSRLLTPLAACSQAEWLAREQGRNTLCVFDDLNAVTAAGRELTARLGPLPRRPGESAETLGWLGRLLDRPCRLAAGGSVTAVSIVERVPDEAGVDLPGPLTSYFSGVIVLDGERHREGCYPAIDSEKSSRTGTLCPLPALRLLRKSLEWGLRWRLELEALRRSGVEPDVATTRQLAHGERLREALRQSPAHPIPPRDQFLLLFAAVRGHTGTVPPGRLGEYERALPGWLAREHPGLMAAVVGRFDLYGGAGRELDAAVAAFTRHFLGGDS